MKEKENIVKDDYGWFKTDGMEAVDAMEAMTSFLKAQHQSALELTKLILDHCKIENLTKSLSTNPLFSIRSIENQNGS